MLETGKPKKIFFLNYEDLHLSKKNTMPEGKKNKFQDFIIENMKVKKENKAQQCNKSMKTEKNRSGLLVKKAMYNF